MQRLINCIVILLSISCLFAHSSKTSDEITEKEFQAEFSGVEEAQKTSLGFCGPISIAPQLMMNPAVEDAEEVIERLTIGKSKSANSTEFNDLKPVVREENITVFSSPHTTTSISSSSNQHQKSPAAVISTENQEASEADPITPLSLDDFRNALISYPSATRLVIIEQEGNCSIQACDDDPSAPGRNRSENKDIIDRLREILPALANDSLLQYQVVSNNNNGIRIGFDPLSTARLRNIIDKVDNATIPQYTNSLSNSSNIINDKNILSKQYPDSYPLEEQDESGLLNKLLSPSINTNNCILIVAHSGKEERFSPIPETTASCATPHSEVEPSTSTDNSLINNGKSILLFGFNVPDVLGPRLKMELVLHTNFNPNIKIKSLNDYNKYLNIGVGDGITFTQYLSFIDEAKRKQLCGRVTDSNNQQRIYSLKTQKEPVILTDEQASSWAKFLSDNIFKFDFSKKLETPEAKKRFISKNFKGITKNEGLSLALQVKINSSKSSDWNDVISYLDPALQLIVDVGRQINTSNHFDIEGLTKRYQNLPKGEKKWDKEDQKKILDYILYGAFFRKTSKLGLDFAKTQEIPVCFVWKLPDFSGSTPSLPTTLKELHEYLERKPYYKFNFTENNKSVKYMEAITSSEMRYLTRLEELGRLNIERFAPNYLLIREIIPPALPTNTTSITSTAATSLETL